MSFLPSPHSLSMVDATHEHIVMSTDHSERAVKDPIHDHILISSRLGSFIDTRQFQRLRFIKQLGASYYIWPGASHNRFEHCLGVAHLARLMARHLQKAQPELKISNRDVECVEIAGLCHDLGHGPWSHIWDNTFIPRALPKIKWRHEDASEMMFDHLVTDNKIGISDDDQTFIKALIVCAPDRCRQEKPFLFEIVSNSRNGIDVDKFDYILRDTRAVGENGNLSLTRLIRSARVIDNQICYDIKDANQIYELFWTRFSLHKRIYNHKTAKAIEYMIVDALLLAEPCLHIAEQVFDPEKFVYLTEDIMSIIERSTNDALADARRIIKRIRTRDLYKLIDYKIFTWEFRDLCRNAITPKSIVNAVKALPADSANVMAQSLSEQDVIVDLSEMHYGMKEKNPMDFVRFYSKNNPNQCAKAEKGDISLLMPATFGEFLLRVYARNAMYSEVIQKGYRAVIQEMSELQSPSTLLEPELILPTTELPMTPRVFSRNPSYTSLNLGGSGGDSPPGSGGSFSVNNFTTILPRRVSPSPTTRNRRDRTEKRQKDGPGKESPVKKRRH